MMKAFRLPLLAVLLLSGCGAELDSPGEALRVFASTVDPAYLNEDYTFDFVVQGGLAPYGFQIREGQLPPGLSLENGTINGTPTRTGRYRFTLQVSDANLSQAIENFTLEVTEAPPARLVLNVPPTDVTGTVRVPIGVEEARNLQALRTQITWDSTRFRFVQGSVEPAQTSTALLQQVSEGQLSIDLAFLGPSLTGDAELFSFELEAVEPNPLALSARTEYRSRDGDHGFSTSEDGAEGTDGLEETDPTLDPDATNPEDLDGDGLPDNDDPQNLTNPGDDQ
jgi:hypothetical protein